MANKLALSDWALQQAEPFSSEWAQFASWRKCYRADSSMRSSMLRPSDANVGGFGHRGARPTRFSGVQRFKLWIWPLLER